MYSNNSEYDAFNIEKNRAINLWHNDILCLNGTLSSKYDSHDEPNSKVSSSDLHGSFYNIGVGMAEDILSIDYEQEKISSSFNDLRINKKISTFRKNESSLSKYNFLEENSFEKSNSTNENYLIDRLPCSKKSYNNDSLEKQSSEFSINYSSITDPNSLHDANSCACEFSFNPLYNKSIISNLFDSDYSDSIIPKNQVTPKQQCQSKVIESIKTRNYLDEDDDFKPNHNSNFLEEFKNSSVLQNTLQLRDLVGHMAEFSKDQHGSRLIQHRLEKASQFEKSLLLNEMVASNISISLVTDAFGNYVVQKMIEHGSMDQRKRLVKEFQGRVLSLSLQMYGCRVIQKSLEYLSEDVQISVISELDGHVIRCVKDQNGNHVIQKCIECINPIHLNKIVDSFKTQVFSLSVHPYGCRVIQRILEYCNKEQKIIILNELQQSANYLVKDQYGNYVIQHVIEHGSQEHRLSLIDVLCDETYDLSQHKFASNVIEKCIVFASKTQRARIIDKICLNNEAILVMTKDQFANYVVQKMLDLCEVNQRKKMLSILKPNLSTLRKYTYGKHIVAKVEKWMSLPKTNNGLDNRKENRNSLYVDIPFKNKSKSK